MPRPRIHQNAADKQYEYRKRQADQRLLDRAALAAAKRELARTLCAQVFRG